MDGKPSVFVSYSWDDEVHKAWVRDLAERLTLNGVVVRLDDWDVQPGQSLTQFMDQHIAACDFVLVVGTPNYAERSQARTGGVGYEQQIISGHIAAGIPREKFIPVVRYGEFKPGPTCALPPHFLGIRAIDMRGLGDLEVAFEELLRTIYQRPKYTRPPLGNTPAFGQSNSTNSPDEEFPQDLRLPSVEIEGWYLDSGLVRNQLDPDTFEIPSDIDRNSIPPTHLAKLLFHILVDEGDGPSFVGERMWVKVESRQGPYYVGTLANQPVSFTIEDGDGYGIDAEASLQFRDRVVFLPENVIAIRSPDEATAARRDAGALEISDPLEIIAPVLRGWNSKSQ
jgi:hypothetical protein